MIDTFVFGVTSAADYIFDFIPKLSDTILRNPPLLAIIAFYIFRKLVDILKIIKG